MKIVDRISLNLENIGLWRVLNVKMVNFSRYFQDCNKIDAEQIIQGLWLGKGYKVSQHPNGKEKKQR